MAVRLIAAVGKDGVVFTGHEVAGNETSIRWWMRGSRGKEHLRRGVFISFAHAVLAVDGACPASARVLVRP